MNTEPRKMKQANKALVTRFYEKKTADIFVNNGFVPLPNIVLDMMPEFGFTCQEQMLIVHIMRYQDYIVTDKQLGEKMQMSVSGIQRIKRLIKTRTMNDTPLITVESTYDPATGKRTSSKYNLQFFFLALKEAYFDRKRAVDKSEIHKNPESRQVRVGETRVPEKAISRTGEGAAEVTTCTSVTTTCTGVQYYKSILPYIDVWDVKITNPDDIYDLKSQVRNENPVQVESAEELKKMILRWTYVEDADICESAHTDVLAACRGLLDFTTCIQIDRDVVTVCGLTGAQPYVAAINEKTNTVFRKRVLQYRDPDVWYL